MDVRREISSNLDEAWAELESRWKGEDSNAFYQRYIIKINEEIEDFEFACSELCDGASELMKKLQLIEQCVDNM